MATSDRRQDTLSIHRHMVRVNRLYAFLQLHSKSCYMKSVTQAPSDRNAGLYASSLVSGDSLSPEISSIKVERYLG